MNAAVTNPSGLLYYVPPLNEDAQTYAAIPYAACDAVGAHSFGGHVAFGATPVNDPPVAGRLNRAGANNRPGMSLALNTSDVEDDPLTAHFTQLPGTGHHLRRGRYQRHRARERGRDRPSYSQNGRNPLKFTCVAEALYEGGSLAKE